MQPKMGILLTIQIKLNATLLKQHNLDQEYGYTIFTMCLPFPYFISKDELPAFHFPIYKTTFLMPDFRKSQRAQ